MKLNIGRYPKNNRRKVKIQIEKFDTWNLDSTLALIILPALMQLKATKHGVPGEFADVGGEEHSCQESFDFYKETHNDAFDLGAEKWEETLDKMIWSFQQLAIEDYNEKYSHGEIDISFEKSDHQFPNPITGVMEPTFTMKNNNPDHWIDFEGLHLHEQRIQEGLELFGKYYRTLWD